MITKIMLKKGRKRRNIYGLQRNNLASILLAHPLHRKICSLHHPHLKNISVQYPILTKFIPMFGCLFCLFVCFVCFVVLFSHNVDIQALSPSRGMVYPSVVAEDWNRLWKIKSWKIWICFVLLLLIWIEWRHLQSTVLHHHRELSDLPSLSRCIWSRMKVKIELNWSWAFYQRRRRHNLKCVECACRLSLKRDQIF